MADDMAAVNGTYVVSLRRAMTEGSATLANFPGLLKNVLEHDRWRLHKTQLGDKPVQLPSFEAFVTTPPLEGLGTSVRTIRNLIRDDPEAIELLDRALERPTGKAGHNVDNVNVKEPEERPDGNSAQQAIRKLRKDRPDLLERVKAKELTPHAAMIEAGFRVRQIQVPAVPAIAARRLAKHFDVRELIAELSRYVHD